MHVQIGFKTDNAAFTDYPEGEIELLLNEIISKLHQGFNVGIIRDSNGNRVGKWYFGR